MVNVKARSSAISSYLQMDVFSVEIHCLKGGGVHHRVVEGHLFSGFHLLGRTQFSIYTNMSLN